MISDTFRSLAEHLRALCVIIVFSSLVAYYRRFSPKLRSMKVPSMDGKDGPLEKEFCSAIMKGTATYSDKIYKLNTFNYETIILPHRYIDEVKAMPDQNLSLIMELYERQLGRFTLLGTVGRAAGFVNSIRMDLNKNLTEVITPLLEEAKYVLGRDIGHCEDWKPVRMHHQSLQFVASLTSRVFVGTELSRNEEWTKASIKVAENTFTAAFILWYFHWSVRPILACLLPPVWNIHRQNRRIAKLLDPLLRKRLQGMSKPDFKPPVDMLQFFLENLPNKDSIYQAQLQSAINVAAIHTTSMALTQILLDLAANPEYIVPLREEIEGALAEHKGVFDKNLISKLRKCDSFLRESQRLSPPQIVSMARKVQSATVLSDGVILPEGCLVACDAWSATRDPELWSEPEKFDGFRFEKLRAIPGNESKYQFVTTSPANLAFGHGPHSCPGRFFAAIEVKILLSHIILNYDIMLRPGCKRPQNIYFNTMVLPDEEAEILFRTRKKN